MITYVFWSIFFGVSRDALSNACAADGWKNAQANSSTWYLLAFADRKCRGILGDLFSM